MPFSCDRRCDREAEPRSGQLALEPGVRLLHRPCRPLLRGLEQAHRTALDDHVHRTPRLGQWVLISGTWYNPLRRQWGVCLWLPVPTVAPTLPPEVTPTLAWPSARAAGKPSVYQRHLASLSALHERAGYAIDLNTPSPSPPPWRFELLTGWGARTRLPESTRIVGQTPT